MDRKSNPYIIRSYGSTAFSPPVPTQIQVEEGGVRIIKLVRCSIKGYLAALCRSTTSSKLPYDVGVI